MSLKNNSGFYSFNKPTLPIRPSDPEERSNPSTDFTPKLDIATKGDLSFIPRYTYKLIKSILDEPFRESFIHSFCPTDFKQANFGNCWEVACLKAILDKPFGILILQDVLRRVDCFTWEFKRPTRDESEESVEFDIRNTFFERSFKSDGKLKESLFLDSDDQYYINFTYGLLKAMDPLIRSNKEIYNCPLEVGLKDTMEIANGFYPVSVLFFLFKNIASDLGRMHFTSSAIDSYNMYKRGDINYSKLRDRDFRVYELIEICNDMECNSDNYISIASFYDDFECTDTLSMNRLSIYTEHAYYIKSYSSLLDIVTLVDPNYRSSQIHISFSSFLSKLATVEYAYFKDKFLDFNPGSFVRNTPLAIVPKIEVKKNCSEVEPHTDCWLDFNPSMIISTKISDYNILMANGIYRVYDRKAGVFLPILSNEEIGGFDVDSSKLQDLALVAFSNVFREPYEFLNSYCHSLTENPLHINSSFRINVYNGYLVFNSPVEAVCIYPDLSFEQNSSVQRVPYDYRKFINPIFIRYFKKDDFGEIVIYQTKPDTGLFHFVVNGKEFTCKRNIFETKKFFNLEHEMFFEPHLINDKGKEGFYMSMEHINYGTVNVLLEFKNITTQFFS